MITHNTPNGAYDTAINTDTYAIINIIWAGEGAVMHQQNHFRIHGRLPSIFLYVLRIEKILVWNRKCSVTQLLFNAQKRPHMKYCVWIT